MRKDKYFRGPIELDKEIKKVQSIIYNTYKIRLKQIQALRLITWKSKNNRIPISKDLLLKILYGGENE
jgi:hypothetical protein